VSETQPAQSVSQERLVVNVDSILSHTQSAVVLSSEIVDFMLNAMSTADLQNKPHNPETSYKFTSPAISAADRRAMFENWLFSKAFADLMRGVRASLEDAYVVLQMFPGPHRVLAGSTLEQAFAPFRDSAAKMRFPQLLSGVNEKLATPLLFSEAYESLQKARNCFEHRSGIVGAVDAPAGGVLILQFPRAKVFYFRDGKEVELVAGHQVDAGDGKPEVQTHFKRDIRERRFGIGHRIALTASDFNEIAFACNLLATTLLKHVSDATQAKTVQPAAGLTPV
jgi:hypothetical protein